MKLINVTKEKVVVEMDRSDLFTIVAILTSVREEYEVLDPDILNRSLESIIEIDDKASLLTHQIVNNKY